MGLDVKNGSFTLATTDSGQKQIRSVGFQPTVVLLFMGFGATEDTWAANAALGIGVMTASGQATVSMVDVDGIGTSDCASQQSSTSVLRGILDGTTGVDFDLTPGTTRFDADGFDLTVADAPAANKVIHWIALAGSDLTGVEVGSFTATGTAVGNTQDVTIASGWGKPDLLLFFNASLNATTDPTIDVGMAGISLGFAVSDTERASCGYFADDGEATMDTGSWLAARALMHWRDTTTPTLDRAYDLAARADWPTDGFRLVLQEVPATPQTTQLIYYVALQGTFQKKVALDSSPTADSNQDLDGGFVPKLSLFASDSLAAHSAVNLTDADGHGLGLGVFDGTSQGLVRMQQDDGNTNSVAKSVSDTSAVQLLTGPGATPTNLGVGVASYPSGNTVRVAWTGVGATARQFLWVALGTVPASLVYNPAPLAHLRAR